MVILQFNKLIRNKWIWGVFAIIVGGAFAFDFVVDDLLRDNRGDPRDQGGAGTLAGEAISRAEFQAIAEDARGLGRARDWKRKAGEVNRQAWETIAAMAVAERNGCVATDAEVQSAIRGDRSFAVNGQFSFARYQALLRENGILPERFEQFLKRRLTLAKIGDAVLGSAAWVSPTEQDQAVADMTDAFTVRVARFTQDKAEADKVKLDDKGLRKWYDENTNSLALPLRVKLRLVKFDATDAKTLAKMCVTTNELHDHYDATVDKYTTTDTNGVEKVKKFEEVRADVEKELRQIVAVQYFETNLNARVYATKAAKGFSRLDEIAKADGLKVETSDWFSPEGGYADGFMKPASSICPGAKEFLDVVSQLDASSEDLRYGVVCSDKAVWLVERAAESPAHVPTFDEAKEIVRPRALRQAKADAFKASVEAIAAKGTNAVLTAKNVSTNITFVVSELAPGGFPDQRQIAGAARKLRPGEVSEFTRTAMGTGLLVVCIDRKSGDAAKATLLRGQIREELEMAAKRQLPEAWQKWNLERLGFETGEGTSVEITEDEE